jgi:undecaprenyl diphosphate synthase
MQRTLLALPHAPLHVALIMDGNGRWAEARGRPRAQGHVAGAEAARRVVEAAPACGIGVLTLFAFSSDNWQRPAAEVRGLMALAAKWLLSESERAREHGVRVEVIGRRDRLPVGVRHAVLAAERRTRGAGGLRLRVALDYSARHAIVRAAAAGPPPEFQALEAFGARLAAVDHGAPVPPVDLLVRTGGEHRLSDFLLWESAYAELRFVETPWPEFGPVDLADAVTWFRARNRRFGTIPAARHARPA